MRNPRSVEDVQALLSLEQAIVRAIHTRDTQSLKNFMAEDFVFRGAGAVESDRAAFLDSVSTLEADILSLETQNVRAHVFGETGILTGTQLARVRLSDGTVINDISEFADVCQRREGRWWVVLAHSITTPEPAPSPPA
ncbi:nuclear transport factor 2 family protein [Myxococcus stipitatus]|uniref:nuclear transport factor 2 family protein n=1 Tax=Myxococcus stipitatus TaxID=83455 RepID=UPI0031456081